MNTTDALYDGFEEAERGLNWLEKPRGPANSFRFSSGCLCSCGIRDEPAGGSDRAGGRPQRLPDKQAWELRPRNWWKELRQAGAITIGIRDPSRPSRIGLMTTPQTRSTCVRFHPSNGTI